MSAVDEGSLGRKLRQGREARGMTLAAVSAVTKISQATLEAIEGDAWGDLPADVYVKGFVRAYCRTVGLPEAGPVEQLERVLAGRRNAIVPVEGATAEEIGRPLMPVTALGALSGRRVKVLGIVGALVLLALLVWLMR